MPRPEENPRESSVPRSGNTTETTPPGCEKTRVANGSGVLQRIWSAFWRRRRRRRGCAGRTRDANWVPSRRWQICRTDRLSGRMADDRLDGSAEEGAGKKENSSGNAHQDKRTR